MIKRILLITLIFCLHLFADNGNLALYLFKNGEPLANQKIKIYKLPEIKSSKKLSEIKPVKVVYTDADGSLFTKLQIGKYQLQVVVTKQGKAEAFIRKNFIIDSKKESQVILSLESDNKLQFADVEATKKLETKQTEQNSKKELKKGSIAITLVSSEDGKPVAGARIFVPGFKIDATSNKKGEVVLDLPEGNRTISIIHPDFSAQSVPVKVYPNEMTSKRVELSPAAMELEEFIVLAPHVQGSIAAVMAEEKNSESIANILGAEQISKQGDSTAAGALKRVAGVTLIGGKNIYIRGLGDRYSCTELNGMSLPSPNPLKRTVPLDMFPSGIIGSLQVQKSATPDISATYGGGYVNIRTKQSSSEDHIKIKVGVKGHTSTGESATSYTASSSEWTGYDDGYLSFPDTLNQSLLPVIGESKPDINTIIQNSEEMQELLTKRDLNPKTEKVPYGIDLQVEAAKTFDLGEDHEISLSGNYGYKTDYKLTTYTSYDYIISSDGTQQSDPDNTAVNNLYKSSIQHGGIFNIGYKYHNFNAKYTKLYVLNTVKQTRDINGTFGENNSREHQYFYEWQERELNVDQLSAGLDYELGIKNRFDIGLESAKASEYVPNNISYNYKQYFPTLPYVFAGGDTILRYDYRTTDDSVSNIFLKNKTFLPMLFSEKDYAEVGFFNEKKDREGRSIKIKVQSNLSKFDETYSLMINDILSYGDGSHLSTALESQPKDQYDASLKRDAYYLKFMLTPTKKLNLMIGGRNVKLTQTVDQLNEEQNIVISKQNSLSFRKFLPSATLKYTISDSDQLRFAYGKTFIYPDFREFINTEFIHPVFLAKITGNPDLIETDIESYDLRYDHYFGDIDNVSATLFYKTLKNPIEDTREFTTSTLDRFGFDNADSATLYGIELSWYKNLGFLYSSLKNLVISGNYTYIKSKVELTQEQKEKYVTQDRGLQGLSPYVINLSLSYDIPQKRSLNLSFNKMAKRLMRIALKNGNVILGLDDYEIPPKLLDFTWIEKMKFDSIPGKYALTFKLRNILDSETTWVQGDNVTLKYKTGRSFSLSLSTKF